MKTPEWWRSKNGWSNLLEPLGWLYTAVTAWRLRHTKPERLSVPIVCIGNLTAGGAGKTPTALAVAAYLQSKGLRVHFLSRGHGGSEQGPLQVDPHHHSHEEVGDEPLLLAQTAPAWISRDRIKGAKAAVAAGAQVIIMDDGFQNPGLYKDLSLVVVDGGFGFGNGRGIPAGPLRETIKHGLNRAQALVIIGQDQQKTARFAPPNLPVLEAMLQPGPEALSLRGQKVVAFAGIGRPQKFFETLVLFGAQVVAAHPFADHFPYAEADIQPILDEAFAIGAIPVTTAKDAVRLPADQRQQVSVLTVELGWSNEGAFADLFAPLTAKRLSEI